MKKIYVSPTIEVEKFGEGSKVTTNVSELNVPFSELTGELGG